MDQVDTNLRQYAPEVIATLNASQAVLESIGPAVLVDVAALGAKGADLARAADLAGITRIGSTGEVVLDVSVVSALVAAGLTDRRWVADGGKLMVKLVESGVGAVLLEKAELLRVLAERRLITRLLDLELMDALLDRPEMTKEMFRSGVVKGALTNGVLEALLAAGKEDVVCGLLRSGMLEILMDTGLLPRMMTYERDPTERIVPPTGSIDLSMDEAQWWRRALVTRSFRKRSSPSPAMFALGLWANAVLRRAPGAGCSRTYPRRPRPGPSSRPLSV